ncbi:ribonuclease HI family protein [Lacticaseibacillus porcinae]|uniref:ribonuclease HI family protein n=1 Tax=Lacticaseibacillus porcinae TaxID=1123687 RepID=UPI000F7795B3|nr:ribonuclease HI family protein [Lacticaseibacillus porcinae]
MIKLNTDAATLGNPGPAGAGILIVANGQQDQSHLHLPNMSNHEAEFAAAIAGFKRLHALNLQGLVSFASDSKLVIQSLDKRYAKHYQPQVDELLALIESFDQVLWQWVPERENRGAHMLAQQGLHAAD